MTQEVVARAQAGEHTAFEQIVDRYETAIYNYVYRLIGRAEDAADLTQDTFVRAYRALPKTSADLRLGAWLYRIATNVCLDELRHRALVRWCPWTAFLAVFHPGQVAAANPEQDCLDHEQHRAVQRILGELRPRERACLVLREHQDLTYDEIAAVLGTTRPAVKSLLHRARTAFALAWRREHPDDDQEGRPRDALAA